ncbi:hypothetical protein FA95DRAFT_1607090 [Auriscalpium vulgare]|uniref:Uncharacterized protein n=1 Tax=Auriscalpium vulgare TaxID=40419 RepID=A0ACB8RQD6_9AGAM|nr:hypothetical protein FA95DRAFT_1607090 [Auriscalpium vulgare]
MRLQSVTTVNWEFLLTNRASAQCVQAAHLTSLIGGNKFCLKICPNDGSTNNPAGYCRNTLERLDCNANSPNFAQQTPTRSTIALTWIASRSASVNLDRYSPTSLSRRSRDDQVHPAPPSPSRSAPSLPTPSTATVHALSNCTPFSSAALYTDIAFVSGAVSVTPTGSSSICGSVACQRLRARQSLGPQGDYAWLVPKDMSRLRTHEIEAYINEPFKRSGELLNSYRVALDPAKWEEQIESNRVAAAEEEALAEVDQLETATDPDREADADGDADEDDKPAKPRKRKRDSDAAGAGMGKPNAGLEGRDA